MSQRFDVFIDEPRAFTLKLEACNANYTGSVTATAQPIFSLPTNTLLGYGIPFSQNEPLRQYSSAGVGQPLTNPVAVPAVTLGVVASGKTISISIPFGATFNSSSVEYISGGSPRRYNLTVAHNGATVLSGLITVDPTPPVLAGFTICDAKVA
jgi:hypothetical protein